MAEILVGDWECTFEELLQVFENLPSKVTDERVMLAEYFGTSLDFRELLDRELSLDKINISMYLIEILVDWRSRNPKTATLGVLLEKFAYLTGWTHVEDSLRQLLTQKAKSWHSLDTKSKSKILLSKVKFQGNQFELFKLQVLMADQFDSFLRTHINQNVIQQVMHGKILEMEDMRNGFFSQQSSVEFSPKQKITYSTDQLLGTGSGNTNVYKGTFGDIPVAVKIISNYTKHREAENEIKILLECKGHPNVVIYHASTTKYSQYLLALELCHDKTLSDWVKYPQCLPVQIEGLEILRQTTDGLLFLHENQIIHRDLKLSNILFSLLNRHVFVKIADFGISRLLPVGKQSKTVTSYGGSNGYTASEMLEARQLFNKTGRWNSPGAPKLTKKIDIFSLGCIFYKVLTKGKHPFGSEETLLDYNIQKGIIQTEERFYLEQRCNLSLIHKIIAKNPQERPNIEYIKAHTIFWSYQKMIDFIEEVSNFVESPPFRVKTLINKCVRKFEENYFPQISSADFPEEGWLIKIEDQVFKEHRVFRRRFEANKFEAIKLVRLIRNFSSHCHENQNSELKLFVGEKPNGFMTYWLNCFPTLVNEMRDAFEDLKEESCLKQYYSISDEQEYLYENWSLMGYRET